MSTEAVEVANGVSEWTGIYECDEDGCEVMVAVYDPYGTCGIVLCSKHAGGEAVAGPIILAEPDMMNEEDFDG